MISDSPPIEKVTTLNSNIARELIWRRNAPYFYQLLYCNALEWPSLAVEWWVDKHDNTSKATMDDETLCYLTYGTHTADDEPNYLVFAKLYIPNQDYLRKIGRDKVNRPCDTVKCNQEPMQTKIQVMYEVEHDGQVNRIRHHPRQTNLIATRTPLGEVHIYDKNKFKLEQKKQTPFRILSGHEAEGFSLEWNRIRSEYIVAGSYDSKLSLWDINSRDKGKLTPLMDFVFHKCEIEDVTYHGFHDCIFASCDDDGQTAIWDTRDSKEGPIHHSKQHDGPIHSVQFNPNCPNLFATGGKAKFVRIWDCRNLSGSLFDLQAEQEINQIKWAPKDRDLIWVASDCTLSMWNTLQQKVKFVHAGHTSNISEMDVHPFMSMTVASVDNGNDLQVFQPNHNCLL